LARATGDAVLLIVESLHSSDESLLDDGLGENPTAAAPPPPLAETFLALTPPPRVVSFLFGFFFPPGDYFLPYRGIGDIKGLFNAVSKLGKTKKIIVKD
jgi:hypothetical protein